MTAKRTSIVSVASSLANLKTARIAVMAAKINEPEKQRSQCNNCGAVVRGNPGKFCRLCRKDWYAKNSKIYSCVQCATRVGKDRKYCDKCLVLVPKRKWGHGRRKDANHNEIMEALQKRGHWTLDASDLGSGFPDLIVKKPNGDWGEVLLLEIKTAQGKLSKRQKAWHAAAGAPVHVVRTVDEAIAVVERVSSRD